VTITARRLAGRLSYRVLIAATVPILWMILATLGSTGAAARDITGREAVRPRTAGLAPRVLVLDVRLTQLGHLQTYRRALRCRFDAVPPDSVMLVDDAARMSVRLRIF
jgi:hypothetical protein